MKKLKGVLSLCLIVAVTGTGIIVLAQEEQTEKNCFAPPDKCKWKEGCEKTFKKCPMQCGGMRPGMCPMIGKEKPEMRCGNRNFGKGHFGRRGPGMDPMIMLEVENPEKADELKKLKDSNPEEFGKALKSAEKDMFEKIKAKMDEFRKLVREYRKNKSADLKTKIRASLLEQYEVKVKIKEKMIQKMEEGVKKAKEDCEKAKSMKEKLVDIKLELLDLPPDLKEWIVMECKHGGRPQVPPPAAK